MYLSRTQYRQLEEVAAAAPILWKTSYTRDNRSMDLPGGDTKVLLTQRGETGLAVAVSVKPKFIMRWYLRGRVVGVHLSDVGLE